MDRKQYEARRKQEMHENIGRTTATKGKEMGILGVDRRIRSSYIVRKNCYEDSEVTELCYFRVSYSLKRSQNSPYAVYLKSLGVNFLLVLLSLPCLTRKNSREGNCHKFVAMTIDLLPVVANSLQTTAHVYTVSGDIFFLAGKSTSVRNLTLTSH